MLFDNGHLKAVKNQKDFYELESEQRVILKAYIPTGGGKYPIPPTFLYTPLPSSQPCRVRQAQRSNTAQEPVDETLVRGLPERFLGKTEMENIESKK